MSTQLIKAFQEKSDIPKGPKYLEVSEFYCDTIQGEGVTVGVPAVFLRLAGCVLNCVYCDTTEVWRYGRPYTFYELFDLMEEYSVVGKLVNYCHLIITGGSPMVQEHKIFLFLKEFWERYGFIPITEMENECVIYPKELPHKISIWNNSPKLSSSGVRKPKRYKPEVIKYMSSLDNSWFKFVIECPEDWEEIQMDFLDPGLIEKNQIILMPRGEDKETLFHYQQMTAELAIKHNVRYSPREHIALWGKKTGV